MKKNLLVLVLIVASFLKGAAQDVKVISDVTVVYDVIVDETKTDAKIAKSLAGATKVVYIKGSKSRSELISPNFQQTIIYDSKTDSTVVLREIGNAKYISYLDANKRDTRNKRFEGMELENTDETKTILNYECKKVIAKLKDGSAYNIYYAPSIVPSNKEYEYQFKDLPGFVLEYDAELGNGKSRVTYTASKIALVPVPGIKFDVPKTGYRVL